MGQVPSTHLHVVLVGDSSLELLLEAGVTLCPRLVQAVPGGVELRPGMGVSGTTTGPGTEVRGIMMG